MNHDVISRHREAGVAGDARLGATQNEGETLLPGQLWRRRIPLAGAVILAIGAAIGCQDTARPTSPEMPLTEAFSALGAEKTTVCHAAGRGDNLKFVELTLSGAAVSAHLDEHGGARAGHEGDYLVTAQTPCPPPPPLGQLVICKQVEPVGLVGKQFEFLVTPQGGSYISSPAVPGAPGACFAAGTYPAGTVKTVIEVPSLSSIDVGIITSGINVLPADRVVPGSLSLETRRVSVTIGEGVTQVRFVNARPVGSLEICTVTPAGFTGATRVFVIEMYGDERDTSVLVPANQCVSVIPIGFGFLVNYSVRIGDVVQPGLRLDAVTVDPPDRFLGTIDAAMQWAHVLIGTGNTRVTLHYVVATR